MKNYKLIQVLSYLLCLSNIIIFLYGYAKLPEIVPTHRNISGEIDDWEKKSILIILPLLNIFFVIVISYFISKPEILNYPTEINENNKNSLYNKMKLFLSIFSFYLSAIFFILTMDSLKIISLDLGKDFYLIYILIIILLPIPIIIYFKKKRK